LATLDTAQKRVYRERAADHSLEWPSIAHTVVDEALRACVRKNRQRDARTSLDGYEQRPEAIVAWVWPGASHWRSGSTPSIRTWY
jgi:hypothetical protein